MNLAFSLTVNLLMLVLLTACSGGSAIDVPEPEAEPAALSIGSIYSDVWHSHESFFSKVGVTPNRTIRFSVSVEVTDLLGPANISNIYFQNTQTGFVDYLLGGPDSRPIEDCKRGSFDIYECIFYSVDALDRIDLSGWELVAENLDGEIVRKPFYFLLPGAENPEDIEFIYSEAYSGDVEGGLAALEAMNIDDNSLLFQADNGSQSFRVEFEASDARARLYGLVFYDVATGESIATAGIDSPSIESSPIILNQKTVIDLPFSELVFHVEDKGVDDVIGVHIVLYDEPVEWILPEVSWSNHTGISEFLFLTPQ